MNLIELQQYRTRSAYARLVCIKLASISNEIDAARLYAELSSQLQRHVSSTVRAPEHVIEDACQFAWSQLVRHHARVSAETAYGWLLATAVHEARRLVRVSRREVSLDAELESGAIAPVLVYGPDDIAERRDNLAALRSLPTRQQRILWLKALGLSQLEVADHEHCTLRTIDRQVFRARRRLRAQLAEAA